MLQLYYRQHCFPKHQILNGDVSFVLSCCLTPFHRQNDDVDGSCRHGTEWGIKWNNRTHCSTYIVHTFPFHPFTLDIGWVWDTESIRILSIYLHFNCHVQKVNAVVVLEKFIDNPKTNEQNRENTFAIVYGNESMLFCILLYVSQMSFQFCSILWIFYSALLFSLIFQLLCSLFICISVKRF